MAARVDDGEVVKSPGQLTLTCYAACPDITLTITPDMKMEGGSVLLFIDLGNAYICIEIYIHRNILSMYMFMSF